MLTNLLLVSRNVVSKAPFTVAFPSCFSKDALRDDVLPKKGKKENHSLRLICVRQVKGKGQPGVISPCLSLHSGDMAGWLNNEPALTLRT